MHAPRRPTNEEAGLATGLRRPPTHGVDGALGPPLPDGNQLASATAPQLVMALLGMCAARVFAGALPDFTTATVFDVFDRIVCLP